MSVSWTVCCPLRNRKKEWLLHRKPVVIAPSTQWNISFSHHLEISYIHLKINIDEGHVRLNQWQSFVVPWSSMHDQCCFVFLVWVETNRVKGRDEMEWLSWLEADSEGSGFLEGNTLGVEHMESCVSCNQRSHFSRLQLKWGKLEGTLGGSWYSGLFLWLRCPGLNL